MPWIIVTSSIVLVVAVMLMVRRRRANAEMHVYVAYLIYFARTMMGQDQPPRPRWAASEADIAAATLGVYDARMNLAPACETSVHRRVQALLDAPREG